MKKCILQILLMMLLPAGLESYGRQTGSSVPGEGVVLFSDRNLYVVGEPVLFTAFLFNGREVTDTLKSRVLYCELITPGGTKIAGNKFLIEDPHVSGFISLPGDLITGTYFLRAYTRYMRNYGPYSYDYIALKVINPYRNEVQTTETGDGLTEIHSGLRNYHDAISPFHISTDRPFYTRRDSINIILEVDPPFSDSLKGLSMAVIPEATVSEEVILLPENDQVITSGYYFTENTGLTITGRLTDNTTGRPLSYKRISLSVLGKGKDFMAMQTDTLGRFFFPLPDYTGYRDLFICAEKATGPEIKILADNDFCTEPVLLRSGKFELSSQERDVAYRMSVNIQLRAFFPPDTVLQASAEPVEDRPFYGKPDDILYIDNYIELPTLEEYLNGLPTLVRVRKSKGEKYFRLLGPQAGLNSFEPLVLIDMVAVDDPARILALSPSGILRIEVVNEIYVKGDETFGGIISIISRLGDFAGIDLPESGVFINYEFLSGQEHHIPSGPLQPNLPDTRNTLFWDPDLRLRDDGTARIKLTASDMTGRYRILLFGVSSEGERILQTADFEVVR